MFEACTTEAATYGDGAMAMLERDCLIDCCDDGNRHTVAVFRGRTELRRAMAATRDSLVHSLQLLKEVDAALADIGVPLRQPKLDALPADLRHLL